MQSDVFHLLNTMGLFPSLSGEEDEICSYIHSTVTDIGVYSKRIGNSVYFTLGEGPNKLLLASHLDVVPPSSSHPYPPFEPTFIDGKIYGRGISDAKASGAAMISAFLELHAENWKPKNGQLIVALTECEEVDHDRNGLRKLLSTELPTPQAALIGEPTSLCPIIAQKGLLVVRLNATGKSAHAARPTLGENAVLMASDDIQRLSGLRFDKIHPILGSVSINITTIQGGTARNVIPEQCTMYVDIRTTPSYTHDEIVQILRKTVKSEVIVHSDRIVPVSTSVDELIVEACLNAVPGSTPQGSPTASDWIYLQGVPAVKIGPGSSELSHTSDEHVDATEVLQAVSIYKTAIRNYFR